MLKILKITLTILIVGCSLQGCIFLQATTSAASAVGSYYSYQAYQQDPVNVTTLSKDCLLGLKYARISCNSRVYMTDDEKAVLAENNRKLVELCGIEKPAELICSN